MTATSRSVLIFVTVLWVFTTFFWIAACLLVPYLLLWVIGSVIIFSTIQKMYGGVEWMSRDYMN